jgi:hypothetical protein
MVSRSRPILFEKPVLLHILPPQSPLGKTPHKARVVSNGLSGAVVTLLDMAAEGSGAACADVTECPQLRSGKTVLLAEELLFVLAKDIGDFEPMSAHC